MKRRGLSGVYVMHKFDDEESQQPTCLEDCPVERQELFIDGLNEKGTKELILLLCSVLRNVADEFNIVDLGMSNYSKDNEL